MPGLRVRLFGRASIEVNGQPVKLTPTAMLVFIRLIIAEGVPLNVDEIFRDVWSRSGPVRRDDRISVQKRIHEIRRAIDPQRPGEESQVLRTERGRISAYRLAVERDSVDLFEFQDFIAKARRANPAIKVDMLRRAIDLWSGAPLADAADRPWAAQAARQLTALQHTARLELAHAYDWVGRPEDALEAGEQLSWDTPDDTELSAFLSTLRGQLRAGQHKQVFRHDFADPDIAIVLMPGDLFAQDDANLVVGFTDTFDTEYDRNLVISGESVQGQLTQRLYDGDRRRLDRELKTALLHVAPESVETPSAKPRGKRVRYPLGTVATLHHAKRRVFAVAYSRMGNNLVAHSSLPVLRVSLENLWTAVYLHGQLKPVAIPLIGSGLARVHEASFEDLLIMIISSFVNNSRTRYVCPELRIIIQRSALKKIRTEEVLRFIREFDPDAPAAGEDGELMAQTHGQGADSGTRTAAIEVLEYILKLEMTPARWERLTDLIEIAIEAEAAGDRDSLRQATVELELAGPVRITRIGDSPSVPPPPRVRERVNHLIHALSTDAGRDADEDER